MLKRRRVGLVPSLPSSFELSRPLGAIASRAVQVWRLQYPPLVLTALTVAVFWRDLTAGVAYFGSDTMSFYYPLTGWYAAQLKAGQLPLWIPYMFGGYPLFADGEIGMLYPPNLLLYGLLPFEQAYAWSRPLHVIFAGLTSFWFARLLGLRRLGALIAALVFSYGSFLVSHLQHDNILHSTVWLPLLLGCTELALRAAGQRRVLWLLAAGLVLGVQMLGVHVQPVLTGLLLLSAYALCGPFVGAGDVSPRGWIRAARSADRSSARAALWALASRSVTRAAHVALIVIVGAGLAAPQLLPLYQLGARSMRWESVGYEFSTTYSVPPTQLLQLVLPYLFRPDSFPYWGLWSPIETTVYLGVAPLVLMLVAAAYLRRPYVLFFSLVAAVSLLLTLGDYLPLKLYSLITAAPGFSLLRVPARFSLLFVFAGGIMAGAAADWLGGRSFEPRRAAVDPLRVRRLAALALAVLAGALAIGLLFAAGRAAMSENAGFWRQLIETHYLSLRRGDWTLSASTVYFALLRSLDLSQWRTLLGLALMASTAGLLLVRGRHRLPGPLWSAGLIGLVAIDLYWFAIGFNPVRPVNLLQPTGPVVQALRERNGLHRVFIEPALYGYLGPNQLVGLEINHAGGYSSLEPRRAMDYFWSIVRQDNVLLDLFNVRYVVAPRATSGGLAAFEGTLFHPADRLMRGSVDNPAGTETFQVPSSWTRSVTLVGHSDGFVGLPYGTPIAEVTLAGPDGEQRVTARFGPDVDDRRAPLVGPWPAGTEGRPARTAWTGPDFRNSGETKILFGSELPLEQPMIVTSVTVRRVGPPGLLTVLGLGLNDREGLPPRSIAPADRAKYRQVYQDQDIVIYENLAALPRAFLVHEARTPTGGSETLIDEMLLGRFDPRQAVMVESALEPLPPTAAAGPAAESAEVVDYRPDQVRVAVDQAEAGYLVLTDRLEEGWTARVDGATAPLIRADALFRAVEVPAGRHEVLFSYEPLAVRVGIAIAAATLTLVVLLALIGPPARRPT